MKQTAVKIVNKVKNDQAKAARRAVLEDIFYDMYRSRAAIYKMNFVRGIFLGFGTVLGGTIVVALLVWVLSLLAIFIPSLKDFFDGISHLLDKTPQ